MKYLVSGYCLVPMKAEIEVEAETAAMTIAKAEWKRNHRSILVPSSDDQGSACDWRPPAEPQTN